MADKIIGKKLLEKEEQMSNYGGRDRIVSSIELAKELKETDSSMFTVSTGIASMDRILGGGVEAGELIIVTGPTGEGKTTLLMTITRNMAKDKVNSVWFTLEVTPRQFLQKLTKASPGMPQPEMPFFYIPRSVIEDADEDYVKEWEKKHRRTYEMIDWLEDKIIEAKVKTEKDGKALKAVFIDHIHQIFSLIKSNNVSLEMGDMVARIKNIAIIHNLAIFLIAHTKDDPQGTMREPRKEDIRDSGLISRLADAIIGVWRIGNDDDGSSTRRKPLEEDDTKSKVRVFKNRGEGTVGYWTMYHVDHYLTEDPFFADEQKEKQAALIPEKKEDDLGTF